MPQLNRPPMIRNGSFWAVWMVPKSQRFDPWLFNYYDNKEEAVGHAQRLSRNENIQKALVLQHVVHEESLIVNGKFREFR